MTWICSFHRSSGMIPTLENESEAVGDCMRLKLKLLPPGVLATADNTPGFGLGDEDVDDSSDESDSEGSWDGGMEASDEELDDENDSLNGSGGELGELAAEMAENETPSTSLKEQISIPEATLAESEPVSPSPSQSSTSESGPPQKPQFEPLSFVGTSEQLHFTGTFGHPSHSMPHRSIRGTVTMNVEGEVIWNYMIRYGGADQWMMRGVQPGGPRSKFGVVGVWSTATHEFSGPNGPFQYFPYYPTTPEA